MERVKRRRLPPLQLSEREAETYLSEYRRIASIAKGQTDRATRLERFAPDDLLGRAWYMLYDETFMAAKTGDCCLPKNVTMGVATVAMSLATIWLEEHNVLNPITGLSRPPQLLAVARELAFAGSEYNQIARDGILNPDPGVDPVRKLAAFFQAEIPHIYDAGYGKPKNRRGKVGESGVCLRRTIGVGSMAKTLD